MYESVNLGGPDTQPAGVPYKLLLSSSDLEVHHFWLCESPNHAYLAGSYISFRTLETHLMNT